MARLLFFIITFGLILPVLASPYYLTREEWLRRVRHELRSALCEPSGYLKTCTNFQGEMCFEQVGRANDQCVAKIKFPEQIEPFGNGLTYGNELGKCVGTKLENVAKRQPATLDSVCGHAFH